MTPYLESTTSITAGTATKSAIRRRQHRRRRVLEPGLRAVRQPQRRRQPGHVPARGRGRRLVRRHRAVRARARATGSCRSRSTGARWARRSTRYAPALGTRAVPLGTRALAEGKHMLTFTVTGKNEAATDWLAGNRPADPGLTAAAQPAPTAVATAEVGGTRAGDARAALGPPATFGAFQPGVAREYVATTTANVGSRLATRRSRSLSPGTCATARSRCRSRCR